GPRPAGGACVGLAIDVSTSVRRAGLEAAARALAAITPALRPSDVVGAIAFASGARVVAAPSATPPSPGGMIAAGEGAGLDPDASDLAAAVRLAAALCPDGTQAALVLASDGQETRGSALAEAALTNPPSPALP